MQFCSRFCSKLASTEALFSNFSFTATVYRSRGLANFEMTHRNILVEDQGPIRVVSINRPAKRNCVNRETASELHSAFTKFEQDDQVLVGILTGEGGNFCAGYDLKELAATSPSEHVDLPPFRMGETAPLGLSWLQLSKPVIAAVSGYAVAGGFELALWCDLRVAEEGSKMGVFCRRFGVPLLDGGTVRLPHLIGLSRAMDLILTGREVGTEEALQMGLVNRVVPAGQSLSEALKIANQIASFPQECMRADRTSAYKSCYHSVSSDEFSNALAVEYNDGQAVLKEAVLGAQQFVQGVGKGGKFFSRL